MVYELPPAVFMMLPADSSVVNEVPEPVTAVLPLVTVIVPVLVTSVPPTSVALGYTTSRFDCPAPVPSPGIVQSPAEVVQYWNENVLTVAAELGLKLK
jgi:hypothetical protein